MPESSHRGALTEAVYYILLALFTPQHGYGIMQYVDEVSQGQVSLGPGTLYGALNTLVKKGWIVVTSEKGTRGKKEYKITEEGRVIFRLETARLQRLSQLGQTILSGGENHE